MISGRLRRRREHERPTAQFTLQASPSAPATARQAVREVLVSWHLEALADTAMLLASELVTNAIRHAGSRFEIVLEQLPVGGFRLAVSDAAAGDWPRVNHAADDDEGGRGMWLVDKLSNSWGTTSGRGGKTVWFELLLDQPLAEKGAV